MFGKNIKIGIIVLSILVVFVGCNKKSYQDYNNIIVSQANNIDKKERYFTFENNDVVDYDKQDIQDYYKDKKELLYPSNFEFTIAKLVSNKFIVGEAREITKLNNRFLSIYDVETQKLENLVQLETVKEDNVDVAVNLNILYANENNILYTTFYKGVAKYYIYDLLHHKEKIILTQENLPEYTFDQGIVTNNYIILSILNNNTQKYELRYYPLYNLKEQIITTDNSGFPTIINDKIYYIEIDNQEKKTTLIEYNILENEKTVKYKTENENEYINFLTGEDKLIVGVRKNDETFVYEVYENIAKLKYKAPWIETPSFSQNNLTYLGDKRDENRVRMQYYLIDFKNRKDINNTGGPIYLSKDAILWLEYKVKDEEIPKGRVFTKDYTKLYYSKR